MGKPIVLIAEELSPATIEALGPDFEVKNCDGANRDELLAALAARLRQALVDVRVHASLLHLRLADGAADVAPAKGRGVARWRRQRRRRARRLAMRGRGCWDHMLRACEHAAPHQLLQGASASHLMRAQGRAPLAGCPQVGCARVARTQHQVQGAWAQPRQQCVARRRCGRPALCAPVHAQHVPPTVSHGGGGGHLAQCRQGGKGWKNGEGVLQCGARQRRRVYVGTRRCSKRARGGVALRGW